MTLPRTSTSSRSPLPAPIPRSARGAWLGLQLALDILVAEGRSVPCRGQDRALWTSEDLDELEAAAHRCRGCPVLSLCSEYAHHAAEIGAWGGKIRGRIKLARESGS